MGSFSIWHWAIVLMVILLLFGSGKISGLMGDLATGIKSFKKNMKEEDDASMTAEAPPHPPSAPAGNLAGPVVPPQPAHSTAMHTPGTHTPPGTAAPHTATAGASQRPAA